MSEYQYYEFQALDRLLTKSEIGHLRNISSRASISSNRFSNVYNFGSFKGNPSLLMEQYFDAFLYLANWGGRELMFKLPARWLDLELVKKCCHGNCVSACLKDDFIILRFRVDPEEGESSWIKDDEANAWLSSLIPLRTEMAQGDTRALYLAWLLCIQSLNLDEATTEPPVPANLQELTPSLKAFVEFFQIDKNLIAVAAEQSQKEEKLSEDELRTRIAKLPNSSKTEFLLRCATSGGTNIQVELLRALTANQETSVSNPQKQKPRTIKELLMAAQNRLEGRL